MELGEQLAEMAERAGDDVEHVARKLVRHFLREPRDAHAALDAHFARIGPDLARDQPQQRRLACAVAADDADALAALDREIACSSSSGPPTE